MVDTVRENMYEMTNIAKSRYPITKNDVIFNERKRLKKNFKMTVFSPIISVFVIIALLTLIGQQEGWRPVEAGSISHIMSVIIFVGFIAIAVVIALFGNRNMKLAENIFLGDKL